MTVLITGANGQLGMCLRNLSSNFLDVNFIFKSSSELDITNKLIINSLFSDNRINYVINCAAYTNVDKAETDSQKAFAVNSLGSEYLALACKKANATLIHISTDFVFDGNKQAAYTEVDTPNPLNAYGKSKLQGEQRIAQITDKHFIIRTSWLYAEHGSNFLKTMLRLSEEKEQISVVNDQIGCPTYAGDLAEVILNIVNCKSKAYGLYHFSNYGQCSWYGFAKEIFKYYKPSIVLKPITSDQYPTNAVRPKYSLLDASKIFKTFNIKPKTWEQSLKVALNKIENNEKSHKL